MPPGQEQSLQEGAGQATAMDLPCASAVQIPALDSSSGASIKLDNIPELKGIDAKALLELSTMLGNNLREIKVICINLFDCFRCSVVFLFEHVSLSMHFFRVLQQVAKFLSINSALSVLAKVTWGVS